MWSEDWWFNSNGVQKLLVYEQWCSNGFRAMASVMGCSPKIECLRKQVQIAAGKEPDDHGLRDKLADLLMLFWY